MKKENEEIMITFSQKLYMWCLLIKLFKSLCMCMRLLIFHLARCEFAFSAFLHRDKGVCVCVCYKKSWLFGNSLRRALYTAVTIQENNNIKQKKIKENATRPTDDFNTHSPSTSHWEPCNFCRHFTRIL